MNRYSHGSDPVVIVGASRTPLGGFQGDLAGVEAATLGATAVAGALVKAGLPCGAVDELLMGCVLPAGQGQAPARQAALGAGLPLATAATTVNKMCGSGMKAVMLGHDLILAGSAEVVVAGGMESMSNAPYLLPRARTGYRMGHGQMIDHMFLDGLEDAYDRGRLMGTYAEECARTYEFTREQQDAFALASLSRAQAAIRTGLFADEVTPVTARLRKGEVTVSVDEQPGLARPERIPTLPPAFCKEGTVTAANSSSISDGAAALVLMRQSQAEARGLTPRARILGHATYADAPGLFPVAPISAIRTLMARTAMALDDIDLWEVNEAFAVVTMAAMRDLQLPHEVVNVHGGACALGHPIGASGARILVTLLAALESRSLNRGVASVCIGGGEDTAIAVERLR